jgi:hypothetical protein
MNMEVTLTRAEQRIAQLINIGRPLTEEESDELYRALHADYMRKWRFEKAKILAARSGQICSSGIQKHELELLKRTRAEALSG